MHVIVGTAGHIDHGKTALIKALTGTDADRLPEEKRRGITVDLGFAAMAVGDTQFDFVDVPGHERFVKNMLAGASGIDLVILVIAADEGVMPQTREHLDICRLLGMKAGIVALTKTDVVDAEVLELARLDVSELVDRTFLEHAPIIAVSSRTGDGVEQLKEELTRVAATIPHRNDQQIVRLPVDRSFSVKGFGAVVTGTLASGQIREGDELSMLPVNERVRVRGLQTHGRSTSSVSAGQRVAVNLGGIDHKDVVRGMVLTEPGVLKPSQIMDTEVEVLPTSAKPLRTRQRIRFHIGTVEVLARVQVLNSTGEIAQGEKGLVQVRPELPVTAVPGERFIIRSYSPQMTIAGGVVIDTFAEKHRSRDLENTKRFLNSLLDAKDVVETARLLVSEAGQSGLSLADLQARTGLSKNILSNAVEANLKNGIFAAAGNRFLSDQALTSLENAVIAVIEDFHSHEPIAKGISREALNAKVFAHLPDDIFLSVISSLQESGKIVAERDIVRQASHETELSPEETMLRDKLMSIFETAGIEVPKLDEALTEAITGTKFTPQNARKFFQLFLDSGEMVKVTDEFYFSRLVLDRLINDLRQYADTSSDRLIDVAKFKDLASISRKYAIPLLEYFDRERITRRAGDKRLIL